MRLWNLINGPRAVNVLCGLIVAAVFGASVLFLACHSGVELNGPIAGAPFSVP